MAKKKKEIIVVSKRKTAVARGYVKEEGTGKIRINNKPIEYKYNNRFVIMYLYEPIEIAKEIGVYPKVQNLDIDIDVEGGGFMSQAATARACIARAYVEYTRSKRLKDAYLEYDRSLLVDDVRRKEPKHELGPGARRREQHTKR